MTAGPMRSSSPASRSASIFCEAARSAGNGPNGAMNASSAAASCGSKGNWGMGGRGLRREEHFLSFLVREGRTHRSDDIGLIGRAAVPGPVNDQDGVARLDETLRPTGSAVGCVQPFGALQSAAMHQDNRVRPGRTLRRCFPGHVHGSTLVGLDPDKSTFTGHPEIPAPDVARGGRCPESLSLSQFSLCLNLAS